MAIDTVDALSTNSAASAYADGREHEAELRMGTHKRTLRDAALAAGIMQRARDNAARTVRMLIQSLGCEHVAVGFRPA